MNSKREEQSNLIAIKVRKRVKRYPYCIKINWTIFLLLLIKKDLWKKKGFLFTLEDHNYNWFRYCSWQLCHVLFGEVWFLGTLWNSSILDTNWYYKYQCMSICTNCSQSEFTVFTWRLCRYFVTFVCVSLRDVCLSVSTWRLFVWLFVTFVCLSVRDVCCLSVRDLCLSVCSWNFLDIMFSTKLKFAV